MRVVKIGGIEYNADAKISKTEFNKIHNQKDSELYDRVFDKKKKDTVEK